MRTACRIPLPLMLLTGVATAHAQSSATLYGALDDSLQFVHNANPHNDNLWTLAGGNLHNNRWGLKGVEDLGGGLSAIFQLEAGFSINNGASSSYQTGTKLFGGKAWVGLSDNRFGTLTFGRQFDPVVDLVQPLTADNFFGGTFTTPGDVDNNDNSSRANNAVKYASPVLAGFQFETMYAFGGVAGSTGSGQTWSAAATYGTRPFSVAAGYVRMDNASTFAGRGFVPPAPGAPGTPPGWGTGVTSDATFISIINLGYASAKSVGIGSIAAQYVAGQFTFNVRYSNAQYKPDGFSAFASTERFNVAAAYVGYQATPAALLGLGYTYTHGAGDTSATYNQISLGADYSLSKRTTVYLIGAYQHANGTQRIDETHTATAKASVGSYGYTSGSSSQEVISLGFRHTF
ncbi:porin [Paraburkholderia sp. CNPSo 3157]|uniref:Porin n=1 Tax=Paraburkholderia franconis TaxID=2654983 RepID=A0A7X1NF02_9BURK|nr:porin [Paraburkholderia franconis]MPW20659.1 porin [Paraburkholderia franconis]